VTRLLSYSEISRAMTCQAQWDFTYGGHLAGSALKKKAVAPILSEGKAWGAAVAAYHAAGTGQAAIDAMDAQLHEDGERMRTFGLWSSDYHNEMRMHLLRLLNHYFSICKDFVLDYEGLEKELIVPIPSRSGKRASSRYKLLSYLDGTRDRWLIEFKLRSTLTAVEQLQLNRQIRIYAWAYWQHTGRKPIGVEVHERWNEAPKPPRILKSGRPSHAKDQLCTAQAYKDGCSEHGEVMVAETYDHLNQRRWQQVVPIIFRDGELEEAGRELVSAAKLIQQLDSGELFPVRNSRPQNCRGCAFKEICPSPDNDLVDVLFERVPAKRERSDEPTVRRTAP